MTQGETRKAAITYSWRMAITGMLYTFTVFGINVIDNYLDLLLWQRIALYLLPIIPALMMLTSVLAFYRQMDEVMQRIMTESMLISAFIVGFGSFTYGFLQGAINLPDISMIWILPALIAFQGLAMVYVRLRYQ